MYLAPPGRNTGARVDARAAVADRIRDAEHAEIEAAERFVGGCERRVLRERGRDRSDESEGERAERTRETHVWHLSERA